MVIKSLSPFVSKLLVTTLLSSAFIPAHAMLFDLESTATHTTQKAYTSSEIVNKIRSIFPAYNHEKAPSDSLSSAKKIDVLDQVRALPKAESDTLVDILSRCVPLVEEDDLDSSKVDNLLSVILNISPEERESVMTSARPALGLWGDNRFRDVRDLLVYMSMVRDREVRDSDEVRTKAKADIKLVYDSMDSLSIEQQDLIAPAFIAAFGPHDREDRPALLAGLKLLSFADPIQDGIDLFLFEVMGISFKFKTSIAKDYEGFIKCTKSLLSQHNSTVAEVGNLITVLSTVESQSKRERIAKLAQPIWIKMGKFNAYRAVELAIKAPQNRLAPITECAVSIAARKPVYDLPKRSFLFQNPNRLQDFETGVHTSYWISNVADLIIDLSDAEMKQLNDGHEAQWKQKPFDSYDSSIEFVKKSVEQIKSGRK